MTKPNELREKDDEQLTLILKETQEQLFRLRLQGSTERLEAPSEVLQTKREIARIKTILRERELRPLQGNSDTSAVPGSIESTN